MRRELWRISTRYACAGVVARDGVVVEAAPIFNWMIGKRIDEIRAWKRATSVELVLVEA